MSLIKDQISELSLKKTQGKLIEKENVETGSVDFAIFKKYGQYFGMKSAIWVLLLNVVRYCLWLSENFWLADWSDSSNITGLTDDELPIGPVARLGVYSLFGVGQSVLVVIVSLTFAKGGNF
jgi:hypothetical protein